MILAGHELCVGLLLLRALVPRRHTRAPHWPGLLLAAAVFSLAFVAVPGGLVVSC